MAKTKSKTPSFSAYVETTVDVDIEPDELHDAGWHHETECGKEGKEKAPLSPAPLGEVVASLHRQAHPGAASIALCRDEPCRSMTLDQLQLVP